MKKRIIGCWITGIAVVIWLLAIYWHPLGKPNIVWHIINLLVMLIGMYLITFSKTTEE